MQRFCSFYAGRLILVTRGMLVNHSIHGFLKVCLYVGKCLLTYTTSFILSGAWCSGYRCFLVALSSTYTVRSAGQIDCYFYSQPRLIRPPPTPHPLHPRCTPLIGLVPHRLDVLVFADTTCEPISSFLALGRLAPVQAAFWGTPITSGGSIVLTRYFNLVQPKCVALTDATVFMRMH